jgi:hypothetical protein
VRSVRTILRLFAAVVLPAALAGLPLHAPAAGANRTQFVCPLPQDVQALLLTPVFTDRLASLPLEYGETETLEDLAAQLAGLHFPVGSFEDAYENILTLRWKRACLDTIRCEYDVLSVDYAVDGMSYTSYAYCVDAIENPGRYAAVIIPGSGKNQSTPIYLDDQDNYQRGISAAVTPYWDMYVYVKPNEDFLAINNGYAKLDYEYIVAHLANRGGSYSCRYIVDTLALVKHLRGTYDKVAVIGLSQGGQAALYNALQSEPDGAIISSGFSVLHETMQGASLDQIIIPGMREYLSNDHIRGALIDSDTEFLFTWGRDERAIYGVEAWYRCTRSFFSGIYNVTCVSHSEGHVYPGDVVSVFLDNLRLYTSAKSEEAALGQNAPNPFSSSTRISFRVGSESHVRLAVFDAKGRLVRTLVNGRRSPKLYIEEWDGRDAEGRALPSGTYFYHLVTPESKEVKKMTLAR